MHPEKVDSAWRPELSEMVVRLVRSDEQRRYQQLMRAHHYLGYLPKIGETLWYVATWREQWLALLSFSGSALKCAVRDRWIGWTLRQHYGRLKLVVNNSRFLILPDGHLFNLGSRVLSLCQRRLPGDWEEAFGHGVVLLETFVDPQRHRGTVYRAANWMYVGNTRGYRRTHGGYTATPQTPKMVFLRPLRPDACQILCGAILSPPYRLGGTTMRLTAEQMRSLPSFFSQISDPRPGPREAPSFVHGAGDRRGGRAVRDARLPGHLGLGAKPGAEIARALWLPSRRGSLCRAQRVRPAQCADPRHPRASGPVLATLERSLVESVERSSGDAGHGGGTLEDFLEIVVMILIQSTKLLRFPGTLQLPVHVAVLGAVVRLQSKTTVVP